METSIILVGFEDSYYYTPHKVAKSNADLVRRVVRLVQNIGFEVASREEARQILSLS